MSALPTPLRRQLEVACKDARRIATIGARKALEALAAHEPEPYRHMDDGQRDLRRKLRDQARQLGDAEIPTRRGAHEIKHLVEKLAYDQWHRLLFARFLLENNLLISPEHEVSVTLEDCEELAPSLGLKDAWAVAAQFAARELPQIFRADDSAGAVEFAVEDRNPLIQLVVCLPTEVFTASDALGWCYQFWQAERKDEVNAAGNKIGADELPAVTQLFTEDYMVDFLLDNTLGAWHAGKVLAARPELAEGANDEEEVRNAIALPGSPWRYLRFTKGTDLRWTPAAGTFDGWPKAAKDLKCLDPCMGSGHFVVAMFDRLVALLMAEGMPDEAVAVEAVIRENLFGLEIDPRCTQIAAFNLALAAWRRVGHCPLPPMNLACSGLAPNAKLHDWLKLAGSNEKLRNGMELLYGLFNDAPVLGSLINPRAAKGNLLVAAFHELQPLLETALAQEMDDTAHEMAVTARGLANAAEILAGQFTLIATNVPYLATRKQCSELLARLKSHYYESRFDLATALMTRCLMFAGDKGTLALVTPQTWQFLGSYKAFRVGLLRERLWGFVVRLGPNAFETISGEVVNVALAVMTAQTPGSSAEFWVGDTSAGTTPREKEVLLSNLEISRISQMSQLKNPDAVILFDELSHGRLLSDHAQALAGILNGDAPRFRFQFWEVLDFGFAKWSFLQENTAATELYAGRSAVLLWESGNGQLRTFAREVQERLHDADKRGNEAWGHSGVAVSRMGRICATVYTGELFDQNVAVVLPRKPEELLAIWAFCESPEFSAAVRKVNPNLAISSATVAKIPFDFGHWREVAAKKYPNGLPEPFSRNPTQWLFSGHPKGSTHPLHVAVARLLGYQWPRQTGATFANCPALPSDGLEKFADADGIVCLSAAKGEAPAAGRLRDLLAHAWGNDWNSAVLSELLGEVGYSGKTLDDWLRNGFFEEHCSLFEHRPFLWQIWDGHKSGFSALVNYHKLNHANLEKLTYAYLGDWLRRQQAAVEAGESGSDARLQAARQLQARLKLILEGEPPFDLFVRWKPLAKQPIGWHPDLNDGVRINIRPFATADVLRKRVKIRWDKDRGNEPVRDKNDFPWLWNWDGETQDFAGLGDDPDGNRWNDCHYTNEFKRKAREG